MATVQKREWTTRSGKAREAWIVRYTDQHKKRHIETFAKKGAAVRRKTVIESEVERRTHVARSQSITVAVAGRMWVEQGESDGLERSTVRQYEQHLKWHIEPLLGRIKLADLIEQGFSPKRVQAIMGHSSIVMTFDRYGHLWPSPDDQEALTEMQARLVIT